MSEQNLTITKDRVLKAAESCPTAKKVLTEMFPEAFAKQSFNWKAGDVVIISQVSRCLIVKIPAEDRYFLLGYDGTAAQHWDTAAGTILSKENMQAYLDGLDSVVNIGVQRIKDQ